MDLFTKLPLNVVRAVHIHKKSFGSSCQTTPWRCLHPRGGSQCERICSYISTASPPSLSTSIHIDGIDQTQRDYGIATTNARKPISPIILPLNYSQSHQSHLSSLCITKRASRSLEDSTAVVARCMPSRLISRFQFQRKTHQTPKPTSQNRASFSV